MPNAHRAGRALALEGLEPMPTLEAALARRRQRGGVVVVDTDGMAWHGRMAQAPTCPTHAGRVLRCPACTGAKSRGAVTPARIEAARKAVALAREALAAKRAAARDTGA